MAAPFYTSFVSDQNNAVRPPNVLLNDQVFMYIYNFIATFIYVVKFFLCTYSKYKLFRTYSMRRFTIFRLFFQLAFIVPLWDKDSPAFHLMVAIGSYFYPILKEDKSLVNFSLILEQVQHHGKFKFKSKWAYFICISSDVGFRMDLLKALAKKNHDVFSTINKMLPKKQPG